MAIIKEQTVAYEIDPPDVSQLITEDDAPVGNFFSAKQQRLLVESLYASWNYEPSFIADADIGIYARPYDKAIVPDVLVSLDVELADDWHKKEHRSYLYWEFGKPPDVVIEIVSNKKGGEVAHQRERYAQMNIPYYIVYDPQRLIQEDAVVVYEKQLLRGYRENDGTSLDQLGLRVGLWRGVYEDREDEWLRWFDANGDMLLTGSERADVAEERAISAEQKAARLAEKLRELGINPDDL